MFAHDSARESDEDDEDYVQHEDVSSSMSDEEEVKDTIIRDSLHYTKFHSVRNVEDTHVRKQLQAYTYIDVEDDEAAFQQLEE